MLDYGLQGTYAKTQLTDKRLVYPSSMRFVEKG